MKQRKSAKTIWLSPLVLDKDYDVQFRDDHVHITLGPHYEATAGQRAEFWKVIRAVSEQHGSRRILIEGFVPKGDGPTTDVIDAGKHTATVPDLWMAFSFDNFVPSEQTELFEAIAKMQGARVKFFADCEQALLWLRSNAPA
jgi:hypothetical protein